MAETSPALLDDDMVQMGEKEHRHDFQTKELLIFYSGDAAPCSRDFIAFETIHCLQFEEDFETEKITSEMVIHYYPFQYSRRPSDEFGLYNRRKPHIPVKLNFTSKPNKGEIIRVLFKILSHEGKRSSRRSVR
jgi:hypothetical protein